MPSNQEAVRGFPQDDELWLVKWIDEFRQAHSQSRSASVALLLQKLPLMSSGQLARLSQAECQELLRKRANEDRSGFTQVRVHVGSLPGFTIGDVFQNEKRIGRLPYSVRRLSLLPGEMDDEEYRLGDHFEPPPNWPTDMPSKVLNQSEYGGLAFRKPDIGFAPLNSRCVVFRRRDGRHANLFIVPRMTIFKAFYAPHTDMAKAFSTGRWPDTLEEVICTNDIESGQKTESINDGEQWNIVLRTRVQDDLCWLLSVLFFDPYGRACAESIYARSLQDRGGRQFAPWHATARIPYRAVRENLNLTTRCLPLRPSWFRDEDGQRCEVRKFLVTEIIGSSWPSHYPLVAVGRTNRTGDGNEIEVSELPVPFLKRARDKTGGPETIISSEHDAHAASSVTTIRGNDWMWENQPLRIQMPKQHSKKYQGKQINVEDDNEVVSTGAHTHEGDADSKANIKTATRTPNVHFAHIVSVFEQLRSAGFIERCEPMRSRIPGQQTERNGLPTWSFIDEESWMRGLRPRAGWRVLDKGKQGLAGVIYRSALILEIEYSDRCCYWIEIERRAKESGYMSAVMWNIDGDPHSAMETAMEVIVAREGRNLERALASWFSKDGVQVRAYKHGYTNDRTSISLESVKSFFLEKVGSKAPAGASNHMAI